MNKAETNNGLSIFVKKFVGKGYRLISTGDLTEMQIAEARKENRIFIDESDGYGYVALPWELTTTEDEKRFGNKLKHLNMMVVDKEDCTDQAVAASVTKAQIEMLMQRVKVRTITCQQPTPHVMAIAWLDGKFHLGTAISKSVNPDNFNEKLGIEYSTKDVLEVAENKLWELEGYLLFRS